MFAKWKSTFHARVLLWKTEAKKNGREWSVTEKELSDLVESQEWRCRYSGVEMQLEPGPSLISLDRIDSSCGYVPGNVQFVCTRVNRMKMDMSHTDFLEWIDKIYSRNKTRA